MAENGNPTASDNCNFTISYVDVASPATPVCPANMEITRTFTATDVCGNTNTCTQIITLEDTTDPTATCATGLSFEVGDDMCTVTVAATLLNDDSHDNCTPAEDLTFGVSTSMDGTFTAEVTLTEGVDFTFAPCPASVELFLKVTDECGNTNICSTMVSVNDNIDPVAVCPAERPIVQIVYDFNKCEYTTGVLPANSIGDGSSTDNCDNEVTETNFESTYNCNQVGIQHTTLFAEDNCGNTSSTLCEVEVLLAIPPLEWCNPGDVCTADLPLDLNNCLMNPMAAGCGFWTGDDVSEAGIFEPAGPGSYSVTFTLHGGAPGCDLSFTRNINVLEPQTATLADVHVECSVSSSGLQNLDALFTQISSTAQGGTWALTSGPASGVLAAGNNLQYSEAGCYEMTYTFPSVVFNTCTGPGAEACGPSTSCPTPAPITAYVVVSEQPQPNLSLIHI